MKFVEKTKKPTSVSTLLVGGMSSYDQHRGTEVVHASDLTKDFCPREYAIHAIECKAIKGMTVNAAMRHTFDMGRDIEARIQNDYLGDIAVGHWQCESCDEWRTFSKRPKTGCDREDIRCRWRYREVRLPAFEGALTCGLDLLLDVSKPKLRMVELKTMIKEEFEKLEAPLVEHRIRTTVYLHMIRESTWADQINGDEATVLYVAKSYGKWNADHGQITPFKEFTVKYDPKVIEPLLKLAGDFQRWREDGIMPKGVCPTSTCKRAKKCAVVQQCFSGNFPAGKVIDADATTG